MSLGAAYLQTRPKRASLDATVIPMSLPGRACVALATRLARYGAHRARLESGQLPPAYAMVNTAHGGQGRPRFGCPILRRSKIRAVSRVFAVVHGGVLLLAAHYGAHVGEMALVVSANARLVAPADLAPFIGSAPRCFGLWRWRGSFGFPLAFLGGA